MQITKADTAVFGTERSWWFPETTVGQRRVLGVMAIAIDGKESTKWKMIEVYETFGCYGSFV